MRSLTLMLVLMLVTPMLHAANIWYDNFDDDSLDPAYLTPSGGNGAGDPEWVETDGVVTQTQPKPGDPTYLAVELSQDIEFVGQIVRIRFDEWEDHDRSRAGVGFWLDPNDRYNGYTTLIHNSLTVGNYQFLNDARGWHPTKVDFDTGGVGSWFWMRSEIDAASQTMVGKVWQGELGDEPADWMNETDYTTYGGLRNPTRWVGLNGGTGTGGGLSVVSFDEWTVNDPAGPVVAALSAPGSPTTTWAR